MSKLQSLQTFDARATEIKKDVIAMGGKVALAANEETGEKRSPAGYSEKVLMEFILHDMKQAVAEMDSLRSGGKERKATDISLSTYAKEKWGFAPSENGSPDSLYMALGINPSQHSVESLFTMPEFPDGYRWLVPEIFRDAVRTGLRRNPVYPSLIAAEETITQQQITMPEVKMSEATAKVLGEAESIPMGNVSFAQKIVSVDKLGIGLKVTDEVIKYASLNVLSLFLQDVGVKLNAAQDTKAINILINGEQSNGSAAIPVIGVATQGTFAYIDILRAWIRMGRIGRLPAGMVANESPALEILQLAEFKALAGIATLQKIEVRTPVPQSQALWVHGAMASNNQIMLIDPTSALIKLNAQALKIESERIAERQINASYVTLVTGFAKLFRDASLIIDKSLAYASNGFPSYMDVSAAEVVNYK